mgnify:CR=1 FL=1
MNFCFIVNPTSGTKKSLHIFRKVEEQFKKKGFHPDLFLTKTRGHAIDIMENIDIDEYKGCIVIGGDGTFHEVINGLLKRTDQKLLPIGLIPGGSGNSFLYNKDVIDPALIAYDILKLRKREIDIIEVKTSSEKIYSINLTGWGLVTDIGYFAEKNRWLGPSRYTIISIIEILKNKMRSATLNYKGKTIKKEFTFIVACNTKYVGKGMMMAPNAEVDDGLLDLIIVNGNISRLKLFQTLPKLFKGTHIDDPEVEYLQLKEFSLYTDDADKLNIDGELKGNTPIDVKIIPKAIEIFN